MWEKLIFNLLAFTLFILMFIHFIRKNDTSYVYLLAIQFLGMLLNFIELWCSKSFGVIAKILMYAFSIILPICIMYLELKKNLEFSELLNILLAKTYVLFGKTEEAKKRLNLLIEKNPNSYKGHLLLAKIYENEEQYEMALEEYQTAFDCDRTNKTIYMKIGELYGKVGKENEAITIFSEILKNEPQNYEASIILGDILYNKKEFKEAIQVYMSALKYNQMDFNLYYNMGMAFTMINDFQRAKECYEKAAQINSVLYNAKYDIGIINLLYGDLEEAEKYFMECLNESEIESGSYYYLARISMIKGDTEKAKNYINVAIEEDPNIYKKVLEENIFAPIIEVINKPQREEKIEKRNKRTKKINLKEAQINKHLESTFKLVGRLNNDDIEMISNIKKTRNITREEQERQ